MIEVSKDGKNIKFENGVTWTALQTKIRQVESIETLTIVREDYYDFKGSNLYALDSNGSKLWTAQLYHPSDAFVGFAFDGNNLWCQTWNGLTCEISLQNGTIISKKVTK